MKAAYILLLFLFCLTAGCQSVRDTQIYLKGVSFVGTGDKVTSDDLNHVTSIGANAITLMPFAYGTIGQPKLTYKDLDWQWWGESAEGVRETAMLAKTQGLTVMIKPHLWLDWGSYTGDHGFETEEDWQTFERHYRSYILQFARISEELQLPIYCIGTELERSSRERPEFWSALIAEIRSIYSGKLTYAANWDNYKHISFWDKLDYIGVDAYFPLDTSSTPAYPALLRGWKQWSEELNRVSDRNDRPVIFTEWGYRSADHTAKKPWQYDERESKVNLEGQAEAYRAMFATFADEPWFAGSFVWKWFPHHKKVGGSRDNRYTPQNKPAEEVLREHFTTADR